MEAKKARCVQNSGVKEKKLVVIEVDGWKFHHFLILMRLGRHSRGRRLRRWAMGLKKVLSFIVIRRSGSFRVMS